MCGRPCQANSQACQPSLGDFPTKTRGKSECGVRVLPRSGLQSAQNALGSWEAFKSTLELETYHFPSTAENRRGATESSLAQIEVCLQSAKPTGEFRRLRNFPNSGKDSQKALTHNVPYWNTTIMLTKSLKLHEYEHGSCKVSLAEEDPPCF